VTLPIDVARCRPVARRDWPGSRRRALVPVDDARNASAAGGQILADLTRAVRGRSAHDRSKVAMDTYAGWPTAQRSYLRDRAAAGESLTAAHLPVRLWFCQWPGVGFMGARNRGDLRSDPDIARLRVWPPMCAPNGLRSESATRIRRGTESFYPHPPCLFFECIDPAPRRQQQGLP
jgi:hypothetical protein